MHFGGLEGDGAVGCEDDLHVSWGVVWWSSHTWYFLLQRPSTIKNPARCLQLSIRICETGSIGAGLGVKVFV